MDKIYGFKKQDIISLINYLKEKSNKSLVGRFDEFAILTNKSKGTVRNMYYAIAKKSRDDEDFCQKYLDGKKIEVQKIHEFKKDEERDLVKKILDGKRKGGSVRSVILELSGGDGKLALRYQNKFRNVIKNNQKLTAEVIEELRRENGDVYQPLGLKESVAKVPEMQIRKLQREINGLLDRVTEKLKRENSYLKNRLNHVETENIKLKNMLYGENCPKSTVNFFKNPDKNVLN